MIEESEVLSGGAAIRDKEYFEKFPVTKEGARDNGVAGFFDGIPCKKGHIDLKYVATENCYACHRESVDKYRKKNPDKIARADRRYLENNREKIRGTKKRWISNNETKVLEIKRRYRERHRDIINKSERIRNRERRLNDPVYRFICGVRRSVARCVKNGKFDNHTEDILGYKFNDLKIHLEKQFDKNMNWSNYGLYWVVDHIIPISYFYKAPFSEKLYWTRIVWNINNLRPLEKISNLEKYNKIIPESREVVAKIFEELGNKLKYESQKYCIENNIGYLMSV